MLNFINNIDLQIIQFIDRHFHYPVLDSVMIILTYAGESGAIWIAFLFILLFFKKYKKTAILAAVSLALSFILVDLILKNFIQRPRPYQVLTSIQLLIPPHWSYSFPSGHSSSSFATAVMIILCLRKHFLSIITGCMAILIAFTRLYLKMHYLSDILAGALVGIICALLVYILYQKVFKKEKKVVINES